MDRERAEQPSSKDAEAHLLQRRHASAQSIVDLLRTLGGEVKNHEINLTLTRSSFLAQRSCFDRRIGTILRFIHAAPKDVSATSLAYVCSQHPACTLAFARPCGTRALRKHNRKPIYTTRFSHKFVRCLLLDLLMYNPGCTVHIQERHLCSTNLNISNGRSQNMSPRQKLYPRIGTLNSFICDSAISANPSSEIGCEYSTTGMRVGHKPRLYTLDHRVEG